MMPASLNAIYESVGGLTEAVRSLADKIEANEKRNVAAIIDANVSRKDVHRRLDDIVDRTSHLENGTAEIKRKVDAMEEVTIEVTTLRHQAQGAGTLGHWLLWVGGGVLTVGGWAAAAYTLVTGRSPP